MWNLFKSKLIVMGIGQDGLDKGNILSKAKQYSSLKYALAVIDIAYLLLTLFLFQGLGLSKLLARTLAKSITGQYLIILAYTSVAYVGYFLLGFPLNLYRSFILEHKFCLSNQKIKDWFGDQIKSALISYIITVILVLVFYYILMTFIHTWWLIVSFFWIFFSLILAKLTPLIIIPLFFKYKKLSDEELRKRVLSLADKMKIKILDVFEIDFSKKTVKANAAFVGWGASKRVILADTLKDKYSYDEIEVILAHEFAHYKLKHLLKLIMLNSSATILLFYIIFKSSSPVLGLFKLSSLWDIAALPIVLIYFVIFGIIMQPFGNYISRFLETNADLMALRVTGLKEAFISMMEKLSNQNLSDRKPHPLIKLFFFDHPPVDERIAAARAKV